MKEAVERVKEAIQDFVCHIVDQENAVEVHATVDESAQAVIFAVHVTSRDMKFVTGQWGRTAEAIKTLVNAVCKKHKIMTHTFSLVEKR